MKHKHSLFSFSLMREGFRQCQMIGIFALVLVVLGAVLTPAGYAINAAGDPYFIRQVLKVYAVNPVLFLAAPAAPLMTLVLFHFLNSRAASDLYHALPHKRITLYLSYAASILAWVLLLLVVGTVSSLIACAAVHKYITVLYSTFFSYFGVIFMLSLLLMCGTLLAMSISGTVFTNILLALILLFLPRACLLFLRSFLTNDLPFYVPMNSGGFFSDTSNILFSFIAALAGYAGSDVFSPSWQAYVYTALLSVLYFAVGGWMFCIRRSEAAGQPAPNRIIQHIYRIVVTMTYCIFVTGALFGVLRDGMDGETIFMFVVLYLGAVLIYCLYELLTTKKWRNLLSALPLLGVVAVLNVGILLGMHMVSNKIVNNRPSVQEIESISIQNYEGNEINDGQSTEMDYDYYVDQISKNIEIQDPSALALVSYYLNENIQTWEEGMGAYYDKYYNYENLNTTYTSFYVTIRTEDGTFRRMIWIPRTKRDVMTEALKTNADFVRAWTELPEVMEDSLSFYSYDSDTSNVTIDKAQTQKLFEQYQKERKKCSFDQLCNASEMCTYSGLEFEYATMVNGKQCVISCPVYQELMPETIQMFYNLYYDASEDDISKVRELFESDTVGSYGIDAYSADGSAHANAYGNDVRFQDKEACALVLKYMQDRPRKIGDAYVQMWVYVGNYDGDGDSSYVVELPLDPAFFEDAQVKSCFDYNTYQVYEDDATDDMAG